MTQKEYAALVKKCSAAADASLERAREALARRNSEALYQNLRGYIYGKFLLSGTDCALENLMELARESTKRALILAGGSFSVKDMSAGCMGADTHTTKKLLLLFAIRDAFKLDLDFEKSADLETIKDLADEILRLS